ncbi:hypothetical protein [Amphritea balenae]|uniref:Uncharacterized protein n=1 Tax=Amphritea balenae TaxID=452629 RepID=A0A3P1SWV2_9GAMM|nr:hypothetical protein [Amphritea balenae]RRD01528.1 hypothetical protein EHS89_02935 [Amphritea balenae]GGK56266.1 hypothetical protein GCM10007941_03060 [Amphritea balenae]
MPINLIVTTQEAHRAFGNSDLKSLLKQVSSGFDQTTGLPQSRPAVSVSPDPSKPSASRTITWDLNMHVAESDEDDYEAFESVVGSLIGGANGIASQIGGAAAGVPVNAQSVVSTVIKTMKDIQSVLEEARNTVKINIDALNIQFEGRNGRGVELEAKLMIDGFWACDDPGDGDNKAWFELEKLLIDTLLDQRSSPNRWDADNWDSTDPVPSGHRGRSFMEPHGSSDRTGEFKTQPGSTPEPHLIEAMAGVINKDQTTVSAHVSCNVEASDTVVVVIRRITLELAAKVHGEETSSTAVPEAEEIGSAVAEAAEAVGEAVNKAVAEAIKELFTLSLNKENVSLKKPIKKAAPRKTTKKAQ